MTITLAQRLTERLNKNMTQFSEFLMALDKKRIINMASEIAAVEETYRQLTTQTDFDDEDAEFLLKFQNPLLTVANEWANYLDDQSVAFSDVLYEFYDDENLEKHPLMSDPGADFDDDTEIDLSDDDLDEAMLSLLGAVVSATITLTECIADRLGIPLDENDGE